MILVLTGNGKGKTTSAIGQGIRVAGQGGKVFMIQFIKSPKFPTGEEKTIARLGKTFQLVKKGKGFVGILGDRLPRRVHMQAARSALTLARKVIRSEDVTLLILDEVNVALDLKLLAVKDVVSLLKDVPDSIDVICTGRGAPKRIIACADLVTECKEIKHPFAQGVVGKRSREY